MAGYSITENGQEAQHVDSMVPVECLVFHVRSDDARIGGALYRTGIDFANFPPQQSGDKPRVERLNTQEAVTIGATGQIASILIKEIGAHAGLFFVPAHHRLELPGTA